MATLTFDELQAEYKADIAVSDARYDLIQQQAQRIAKLEDAAVGWMELADEYQSELHGLQIQHRELQVELDAYKAERILLQQEIRSLRRLDPAE